MMVVGRIEKDISFVSVIGDIDMFNSREFKEELHSQIINKPVEGMRIDLREVGYMDSSGIAALYGFIKMARKSRIFVWITNMNDKILNAVTLAGLDKFFFADEK